MSLSLRSKMGFTHLLLPQRGRGLLLKRSRQGLGLASFFMLVLTSFSMDACADDFISHLAAVTAGSCRAFCP